MVLTEIPVPNTNTVSARQLKTNVSYGVDLNADFLEIMWWSPLVLRCARYINVIWLCLTKYERTQVSLARTCVQLENNYAVYASRIIPGYVYFYQRYS